MSYKIWWQGGTSSKRYTYIHNWPLQPFSLASHNIHFMCVNFIREWQFNLYFEQQIFEKLFHGNFIFSQSFCQKSAERKEFFFIFRFWCRTTIFLGNFFMAILFFRRVFARQLLKAPKKYLFFIFRVWCPTWHTNTSFTYPLDASL